MKIPALLLLLQCTCPHARTCIAGTLRVTTKIVIAGDTDAPELDYSDRDPMCLCCPVGVLLDTCPDPHVRACVCRHRPSCCAPDALSWDQQCVDLLPKCDVHCEECQPKAPLLKNALLLQDTQVGRLRPSPHHCLQTGRNSGKRQRLGSPRSPNAN